QRLKRGRSFRISPKPVVHVVADDWRHNVNDSIALPQQYGARLVFAIARDQQTIFASWTIDWPSLFEKVLPVDRQVHLRLYGPDGFQEKSEPVEPMAVMHYLTTSGLHASYHVEIGYYQLADAWHSVAMSEEIVMPPNTIAETVDVDLATIPFHVGFQQLLNLFILHSEIPLAVAISRFEKRALNSEKPKRLTADDEKILRKLQISLSETAAAWRAFDQRDAQKLMRHTDAQLASGATSPARAFAGDWTSGGS